MSEEYSEDKKSKYNTAVAQLFRLDGLWRKTHIYTISGKYYLWNTTLDRLWLELARDLDEKKFKTAKESYDNLDKEIGKIKDDLDDDFKEPTKEEIEIRNNQYKKIMEKELFLRRLENQVGKGTAWDDSSEDDFD